MAEEEVTEEEAAKPKKKAASSSNSKKSNKAKEPVEIPFTGVSEDYIQPTSPIRQRGV